MRSVGEGQGIQLLAAPYDATLLTAGLRYFTFQLKVRMLDRSITLPLTIENNIFNCDKNPKDHFPPVLKFPFFFHYDLFIQHKYH